MPPYHEAILLLIGELIMTMKLEEANELLRVGYLKFKFEYHAELEAKYNATGLSIMQLNETPEGALFAKNISTLIAADMAEMFGE